jgi:hypothetical protein
VPKLGRLAAVTAAPLLLAVAGLVHPSGLASHTADRWAVLHILLLPVFPVVAAGFLIPLRDCRGTGWTHLARVAAYGYACCYTGLDAVAGIAAGTLVRHAPEPFDRHLLIDPLYSVGDRLGRAGAALFIVASLATCAALRSRHGWRVLPGGVVLVVAGWSFLDSHIFRWRGVVTMVGFAVGFALLWWATAGGRAADRPGIRGSTAPGAEDPTIGS